MRKRKEKKLPTSIVGICLFSTYSNIVGRHKSHILIKWPLFCNTLLLINSSLFPCSSKSPFFKKSQLQSQKPTSKNPIFSPSMALMYPMEPPSAVCRRRIHLQCKQRQRRVFYFLFTGIFHKRYLLFLSFLYILGLITYAGPLLTILHPPPPPPPGSLYKSHELFLNLWPEIQADNASTIEVRV